MYDMMWVYYNLFQPVLHLKEKRYNQGEGGGKIRRKWDEAKSPYERLLQTGVVTQEQQQRLEVLYAQTNPRALRNEIYKRLAQLWEWQEKAQSAEQLEVQLELERLTSIA
jgi:hypothetical protein